MEDLKLVFARNLVALRRKEKLTQAELAEKINYSDKAVSKWERAESVPDVTTIQRHQEVYNSTIISVARELDVPVIDIRTPFLWSRDAASLMCRDGVHPSEKGSALIAATVAEFVNARRIAA